MIKRVRKTKKNEAVRSDDRSKRVTLVGFSCEGQSRSIKPSSPYVFMDGHCKANLSILSFNHHEIEMSCDCEVSFKLKSDKKDELEELAEEARGNWVDFNARLEFGRWNRSYDAELSCNKNDESILTLEVNGLDGDQEVIIEGEEFGLESFAISMDADDIGASFDEICAMIDEEYVDDDDYIDESVRRRRNLLHVIESRRLRRR